MSSLIRSERESAVARELGRSKPTRWRGFGLTLLAIAAMATLARTHTVSNLAQTMLPILLWLLSLSTLSSALLVLPPSQQQDDLDSVAKTIRRGLFDSQQRVFGGSVHNNEEESKQPKLKVPVVLGVMSKYVGE